MGHFKSRNFFLWTPSVVYLLQYFGSLSCCSTQLLLSLSWRTGTLIILEKTLINLVIHFPSVMTSCPTSRESSQSTKSSQFMDNLSNLGLMNIKTLWVDFVTFSSFMHIINYWILILSWSGLMPLCVIHVSQLYVFMPLFIVYSYVIVISQFMHYVSIPCALMFPQLRLCAHVPPPSLSVLSTPRFGDWRFLVSKYFLRSSRILFHSSLLICILINSPVVCSHL